MDPVGVSVYLHVAPVEVFVLLEGGGGYVKPLPKAAPKCLTKSTKIVRSIRWKAIPSESHVIFRKLHNNPPRSAASSNTRKNVLL